MATAYRDPEVPDSEDEPLTTPNSPASPAEPTITDHVTSQQSQSAPVTEEPQLTPARSPQEITLAELNAQRAALIASLAAIPTIQALVAAARARDAPSQAADPDPTDTQIMAAAQELNKQHIKLLHDYNEIKDAGQALMGLIADQRGVRIVEVHDEFGIDAND
ncbi:hypothetical protein GRF29_161g1111472 [Pseudopithomyces chartarum]|uniref:Swi5-domain-containing protein n=1 Tax=Pseudopithomyces chartarum TaxID=1892770 RepID=A0AAN6LTC6_9PLEO|nr:hypothetical protein GRF29_161g1111472 [Pseudopithomyces chartarum]